MRLRRLYILSTYQKVECVISNDLQTEISQRFSRSTISILAPSSVLWNSFLSLLHAWHWEAMAQGCVVRRRLGSCIDKTFTTVGLRRCARVRTARRKLDPEIYQSSVITTFYSIHQVQWWRMRQQRQIFCWNIMFARTWHTWRVVAIWPCRR